MQKKIYVQSIIGVECKCCQNKSIVKKVVLNTSRHNSVLEVEDAPGLDKETKVAKGKVLFVLIKTKTGYVGSW